MKIFRKLRNCLIKRIATPATDPLLCLVEKEERRKRKLEIIKRVELPNYEYVYHYVTELEKFGQGTTLTFFLDTIDTIQLVSSFEELDFCLREYLIPALSYESSISVVERIRAINAVIEMIRFFPVTFKNAASLFGLEKEHGHYVFIDKAQAKHFVNHLKAELSYEMLSRFPYILSTESREKLVQLCSDLFRPYLRTLCSRSIFTKSS